MKKLFVVLSFAIVLPGLASPSYSTPPIPVVTDSALAHLKTLADPELFQGRKSGTESGYRSQRWIADRFDEWGLEPLVDDSLLVPFRMLATREEHAALVLHTPKGATKSYKLADDYTVCTNSGSDTLTAPVTIVGHGISKPGKGWDDYGDIDVKDRIVIVLRGRPNSAEDWENEYSRNYLLPEATRRGAAAVLFYQQGRLINGAAIGASAYDPRVPSMYIGDRILNDLLADTPYNAENYRDSLRVSPHPLHLERELHIQTSVSQIPNARGHNVVGVVEGTNPRLRDEAVVFGAHGDHVGQNANGDVYPGADDNASGTAVVMELARVFAQHPQDRTMIFMVFGGEEQGLLGSRDIMTKLPDEYSYVAMVNLDMAGRGMGVTGIGGGDQLPEIWYPFYDSLSDSLANAIHATRAWGGMSSDHAPFREWGIPSFSCYSRGKHEFYHQRGDTYETIEPPAIRGALHELSRWLIALANHADPMESWRLAPRTIWHRGTPLIWQKTTVDVEDDLQAVRANARAGIVGSVLHVRMPVNEREREILGWHLDDYKSAIEASADLTVGSSLRSLRGCAYGMKGCVFLALNGDPLVATDTSDLSRWHDKGLSWIRLKRPETWQQDGSLRLEKRAVVESFQRLGTVVEIPMNTAKEWFPLLNEVGPQTIITGDWSEFKQIDDVLLSALRDTEAGIFVHVGTGDIIYALKDHERINRFKVHLQPPNQDYEVLLVWTSLILDYSLDNDLVKEWIGGNMARW